LHAALARLTKGLRSTQKNSAAAKSSNKKPNEGCKFWVTGSAVFEPVREREVFFFLSLRCLCERKTGEENATRTRGTGAAHRARAREREGMQIPDGKGCRFQRKSDADSREEGSRFQREARQVLDGKRCRFQRGRKQIPK
jgi:hypothetical protein